MLGMYIRRETMKGSDIIKTGIGGTYWMTIYTNISSRLFKEQLGVVKILGSLLSGKRFWKQEKPACEEKLAGTVMHYGIGIFFSSFYHLLWKNNVFKPTLLNGSFLGFINGIIGIAGWKPFIALHPNPPKINYKLYLTNLLAAHVIFGAATAYYYNRLNNRRQFLPFIT